MIKSSDVEGVNLMTKTQKKILCVFIISLLCILFATVISDRVCVHVLSWLGGMDNNDYLAMRTSVATDFRTVGVVLAMISGLSYVVERFNHKL